ncbi:MAG: tRNA (adenosine(37)-N6)-threonylcarbamoyltransferase complex dimerization subunit type 1 TsaB [Planctomycetes bacterium]|nr:tRNA (adenosine(37)-N6)-threonylcarbamoyltransferase complex dimerization subunit type 1 TsaB [Planctomycetota bacterium]NUQ34089.1 tRNA (adenosine(37)-N6)-threonylcarbamoyltransferase complex dimerization subunit type 1 TsaB [Planctomycetaceae bacterium]
MNADAVILAIESSGESGGAAVFVGRELRAEVPISARRSHGQNLVPAIRDALAQAKVRGEDVSAVVVNEGPGSYTGLRVGLAAAETFAFVHKIPVVGIGAMEAMCEELLRSDALLKSSGALCLIPCLDARQDEVMAAAFLWDGTKLTRTQHDMLVIPEQLGRLAGKDEALAFGSGAFVYRGRISLPVHAENVEILPASVGLAAFRHKPDTFFETAPGARVQLRYFRPVMAKTIVERGGSV